MSRFAAGLLAVVIAFGAGIALLQWSPAIAEGFTVTRDDDPEPDGCAPDDCSLREAIIAANESPDADEITIGSGLFTLGNEIPTQAEEDDTDLVGDIDIRGDVTIRGSGARATVLDGNGDTCLGSVFEIHGATQVTVEDLTIANGCADNGLGEFGGAIRSLDPEAAITLRRVAVRDNFADRGGGGLYAVGSLAVFDSLLAGNNGSSGEGAAVLAGTLLLQNSTVSGNGVGAAVVGNDLTVISSTIAENESGIGIPFALADPEGTVMLRNSIIAGNTELDCNFLPDPEPVPGVVISQGHNIDSDGSCELSGDGYRPNTDPKLGPLRDNGGPTWTHALLTGSPALDAVPTASCVNSQGAQLNTDQRGTARPQGSACDIGAYERVVTTTPPGGNGGGGGGGGAVPPSPTPTPTPTPIVGAGAPPPSPVLELQGFMSRGVSLWVLTGGASTADLIASLADAGADPNGCTVASIVAGRWVVLIPGAQDPRVNAAWTAAFPNGVADRTPLWSRCR